MTEALQKEPTLRSIFGSAWFWVTQAMSVIGLISVIEDLNSWMQVADWVLSRISEMLPPLRDGLSIFGEAIHAMLEVFRMVFRPVIDFVTQFLPFEIPQAVKDLLIVAVFLAMGLWRVLAWGSSRTEAILHKRGQISEDLRQAALDSEIPVTAENAATLHSAVVAYWALRGERSVASVALNDVFEDAWRAGLNEFGPRLSTFAERHPQVMARKVSLITQVRMERRMYALIWALAGATATLIFVDLLVFS